MTYLDRNGTWQPGPPPDLSYPSLNLHEREGQQPTPADLRAAAINLSNLPSVKPGTAWATEAQTCIALSIDARALYDDVALVAGCRYSPELGELLFDVADVAARIEAAERAGRVDTGAEDHKDVAARADDLLAEMKRQGIELPGGLGGDAA